MLKLKFTFIFLLIVSISFSQRNEIGISLLNLSGLNTHDDVGKDTIGYSRTKGTSVLQPVITFNHINKNDVSFIVQGGFFYLAGSGILKNGDGQDILYSQTKSVQKSAFIKIGIAQRYYYNRLVFESGINIPFEFKYSQHSTVQNTDYDLANNPLFYEEDIDNKAPTYVFGLYLNQSIYFRAFNNFYLGMDLNLGLSCTLVNGERTYTTNITDYQNIPIVTTSSTKNIYSKATRGYSLNFQPNLGIRYLLPQMKKANK